MRKMEGGRVGGGAGVAEKPRELALGRAAAKACPFARTSMLRSHWCAYICTVTV